KAAGLKSQHRVAMLCPNIPAMLDAHFAVPAAGGILVTINTRLTAEDISWSRRHSGARWLFVDDEVSALLSQIDTSGIRVIRVADSGDTSDPYEAFLSSALDVDLPAADTSAEHELETISINYTSGTTGRPKGVMYSFRGVYL
ncbi:MAG: AMP-binding protein, partial [Phycisphaerae bacterium]